MTTVTYVRSRKAPNNLAPAGTTYQFDVKSSCISVTRDDKESIFKYDFKLGQRYQTWAKRLVEIVDLIPVSRDYDKGKGYYPRARYINQDGTLGSFTDVSLANQIDIVFALSESDAEVGDATDDAFKEGKAVSIFVNKYERNVKAREACLKHHGYICHCCSFDFEKVYGSIGTHFIEVHHIKALHEIKSEYKVDPINDLIPLCANCHRMIHRSGLSLEMLKHTVRDATLAI